MFERFLGFTFLKITNPFLAMLSGGGRGARLLRDRRRDNTHKPERDSERKPQSAAARCGDRFSEWWFQVDLHRGPIDITARRRRQAFCFHLAVSQNTRLVDFYRSGRNMRIGKSLIARGIEKFWRKRILWRRHVISKPAHKSGAPNVRQTSVCRGLIRRSPRFFQGLADPTATN